MRVAFAIIQTGYEFAIRLAGPLTPWSLIVIDYRVSGRGLAAAAALLLLPQTPARGAGPRVQFRRAEARVDISIGGKPFAAYFFRDPEIPRPYFAHVRAPSGVQVTRHHPPQPGDSQDHPGYHPGLWLAFGDIDGNDDWRLKARVVHEAFLQPPVGGDQQGRFAVKNRYLSADGSRTVCFEDARYAIQARPQAVWIVWDSTFYSPDADFGFGDQEEMGLGVRMATPIAVKSHKGGQILDSAGRINEKAVWGHQADWCDYSGTVDGLRAGVTLIGDPRNFRRCWWHTRDYGFMCANPFGRHALTGGSPSRVVVRKGQSFHLRYGVVVHDGTPGHGYDPARAFQLYKNFNPHHAGSSPRPVDVVARGDFSTGTMRLPQHHAGSSPRPVDVVARGDFSTGTMRLPQHHAGSPPRPNGVVARGDFSTGTKTFWVGE